MICEWQLLSIFTCTLQEEDREFKEEENNGGNEGNEGNDDNKREKLTNDLAEIGHVLDDEFCEYVRPDPNQQIALTRQGNIDFVKVWREVEEIDERLLLNDILPHGLHGEKWSGNVTRSALTQYHNDVENYIQKKLAAPPHVWGRGSGAICASPSSSFNGPRTPHLSSGTSTRVDGDGDDDDDDDDGQSNQAFTTDGNGDNNDDGSSSASAPPRDGEQKTEESEVTVEHAAPSGDAIEQHRGGDMRADSPVEVFSQPDPISQCAGNLSAHQGGDLPIQSRPVEVSTQGQHEQESAAARGGKEQIQEQGRRAPQTPQQSKQPGQQGGQNPTPQATHFTGLLRKAAAGADSQHNRSKYDYQRPASSHVPRPRRAHRSKASSRFASSFDDLPSILSKKPRGPAGISQPGTQGASQSQAESFSPDHSSNRAKGRGKPAVSAGSPNVDPAPGSKFSFPSPTASQLGTEAAKVIRGIRGSLQDTSRTPGHQDTRTPAGHLQDTRTPGHQDTCRTPPSPSASQLGTEAEKVIRGIQGNLRDISTPELAASKAAAAT